MYLVFTLPAFLSEAIVKTLVATAFFHEATERKGAGKGQAFFTVGGFI